MIERFSISKISKKMFKIGVTHLAHLTVTVVAAGVVAAVIAVDTDS